MISGASRSGATVTTTAPHLLRVGLNVLISDGTMIEQAYVTTTPTATTFTISAFKSGGFTIGTANLTISDLAGSDWKKVLLV